MPKQPATPSIGQKPVPGPWHDYYFKSNFQTPEQIGYLLQLAFDDEQLDLFDLDTLRIESRHHPGAEDLSEKVSDRVVSVKLKQGTRVDIHLLIEHKSQPDPNVLYQLLDYATRLLRQGAGSVIPIMFYHGRQDWSPALTVAAGQYAGYPDAYRRLFNSVLLDFGMLFINASTHAVYALLQQMPPEVELVLDIMVNIVDADASRYVEWLRRAARLEHSVRDPFIGRLKDYVWKERPSIKIETVRELLRAERPGDELMQEAIDIWEKYKPDSGQEMWDLAIEHGTTQGWKKGLEEGMEKGMKKGVEKGRAEGLDEGLEKGLGKGILQGLEQGMEKGAREKSCQIAIRMISEGYGDQEIQTLTQLSLQEISKLKNGAT